MKRLLLSVALLLTAAVTTAQVTTSELRGYVTSNNNPLPGATIIARHNPSGTEYGAIANAEGLYTIGGMRVGGPYTITFSYIGYHDAQVEQIALQLGDPYTLSVELTESSIAVDDIYIIGQSNMRNDANCITQSTFENIPTVKRSIYDATKLVPGAINPQAGGIIIAGQSTRYNAFTIDGSPAADIYGLGTTGMTGSLTNANPIPLDALEMVRVTSSSVDLRQSGFTGGGIDAITKSGDNTLRGSAYTYFNNEKFYGTTPGRDIEERKHLSKQMTSIVGATIQGPILRDKLFFFVAGEFNRNLIPSSN